MSSISQSSGPSVLARVTRAAARITGPLARPLAGDGHIDPRHAPCPHAEAQADLAQIHDHIAGGDDRHARRPAQLRVAVEIAVQRRRLEPKQLQRLQSLRGGASLVAISPQLPEHSRELI